MCAHLIMQLRAVTSDEEWRTICRLIPQNDSKLFDKNMMIMLLLLNLMQVSYLQHYAHTVVSTACFRDVDQLSLFAFVCL